MPPSERAIGEKLVDELWARARSSLAALLAVLIVAWPVIHQVRGAAALVTRAAYGATIAIAVVRWSLALWMTPRLESFSHRLRYRVMLGLSTLNGVALGVLGAILVSTLDPLWLGVWIIVVAGIAGGATVSLGARPEIFLAYAVPMLGTTAVAALCRPGGGGVVIAPAVFVWLLFSLGQVLQHRQTQRQFIVLNLELDASVRALHETNEDVDRARRDAVAKNLELEKTNADLVAMTQRADRIFSALADALPGRVLAGKYRLDARIGDGGFSVVFRGTHLELSRPVAVKIFRPQAGNDSAAALERFRKEGMASARVRHGNIVEVFDAGVSEDGIPYIAMELLSGRSIGAELAENTRMPLGRITLLMEQTCRALAAAHAAGVIHRDVKPDNIFVHEQEDRGGELVKVLDFGIAKVHDAASRSPHASLTSTGAFLGTPLYMAPERFLGRECDGKADVYSVGVIIYAALAGRLPFEGNVAEIMMQAVSQRPRDLRTLAPDVPDEIADVVMRALEDDPRRRPTAAEVADALAFAWERKTEVA
jgi:hypothetical protein